MDSMRSAMRLAVGLGALLAGGCGGSGQTGSPFDEQRPKYETPGRFSPEDPTGGNTGNPDNPGLGGNRSTYNAKGSELLAILPGGQLVTVVNDRGLLVYDVAEPTRPRVIGELPINGYVLQFESDDDSAAAPAVTILAIEKLAIDESSVPEQAPRDQALRMIRIDLSDPTAPARAAQVDLEGDVWQFVRRGEHYLVLSQWYESRETACGGQATSLEWGPPTRAMRVTDYRLDGGAFTQGASLELPADAGFAYLAGDAIFVPTGFYSGDDARRGSTLSWADFGSGSLIERGPVDIEGRLDAVAREAGVLVTLAEASDGRSMILQTWTLDAQEQPTARGRLVLDVEKRLLELLPGAQRLLVSGGSGTLVDLSDLTVPRVLHQFPAEVTRFARAAEGVIALGPSDTGRLVASLWELPDSGSPRMLGRFASSWPWSNYDPGQEPYTVDVEHSLLLAPYSVFNAEVPTGLGVARIAADGLHEHSRYALQQSALRPISDGATVYSWSYPGFEVVPLVEGASEDATISGYAPFHDPPAIARLDQTGAGGRELVLRERDEDGRFVVEVSGAGGAAGTTVVLEHRGDALVAFGQRVVVVGVRWDSECMYIGAEPNPGSDPAASFDACAPYRARGISVIDVRGEPEVVASFALGSKLDFEPIEGVTAETMWSGYVQLTDGRLLFPVERWLRCSSQQSCAALGTPASESLASPGCSTQQDCSQLPRVQVLTSGAKASVMLYVLDDIAGGPSLQLKEELEGRFTLPQEGPVDVGWIFLPSDQGIAFAREEPIYNAQGNSVLNEHEDAVVRFYLDRIAIGEDGGLRALPSVNTPGRPVAWDGPNVYTVEPGYDERGQVFVRALRSELRNDAAHIEESVELGTGFQDARAVGDQLVVLRGPADRCTPDGRTDLFTIALEPGAMKKGAALDLPTMAWGFPYGPATDSNDLLVVRGGPLLGQAHLEVDLSDAAHPSVVRYTTDPVK
jgi:hypothetical protein